MTKETTVFNKKVFAYILEAIDGSGYDKQLTTDHEKLQFVAHCFKSEYVFPENLRRYGSYIETFRQWIMGLPSSFNVDYSYCDIIRISKEWGSIPQNATGKQEDKAIENWFKLIAFKTFQLMKLHKVLPH